MSPTSHGSEVASRPRFNDYGRSRDLRTLTSRRLAHMVRDLDPELRELVRGCEDRDWITPDALSERFHGLLLREGTARTRLCRRWARFHERLSPIEQWTVIDAHLNRLGRPEVWLFRVGVVDACAELRHPLPAWPMPWPPINARRATASGGTVLHRTVCLDPWVAVQLLDWGADPNLTDARGQTPLHIAARCHSDLVPLFLARRARCDLMDVDGRTPLNVALGALNHFAALLLLRAGAPTDGIEPHVPTLRAFARALGDHEAGAVLRRVELAQALNAKPAAALARPRRL